MTRIFTQCHVLGFSGKKYLGTQRLPFSSWRSLRFDGRRILPAPQGERRWDLGLPVLVRAIKLRGWSRCRQRYGKRRSWRFTRNKSALGSKRSDDGGESFARKCSRTSQPSLLTGRSSCNHPPQGGRSSPR